MTIQDLVKQALASRVNNTADGMKKEAAIEGLIKQAALEELLKQAALEELLKQTALEEMQKQAALEEMQKQAALEEMQKQATLEELIKQAAVEELRKKASNIVPVERAVERAGLLDFIKSLFGYASKKGSDFITAHPDLMRNLERGGIAAGGMGAGYGINELLQALQPEEQSYSLDDILSAIGLNQ